MVAWSRLRDFWYEAQKKAKKPARDRGFQGWNDVAVWRDFKPIYIPADIWPFYLEHVTSERFTRRSQSGTGNRNRPIHGSVTTHTGSSVLNISWVFVQPFYFVSYYVYWIEYDDYFFYFQETYNNRLRERYEDDPLTHPEFDVDLWMEVGSFGGPDKN